jgi:hydrogenase maturation protease
VTPPRSIGVLGLGNVLLGDDAFGPYVIELLRAGYDLGGEHAASPQVELLDVGTPGLGLPAHLGYDAVVLVDTVAAEAEPGTLGLYRRADLDNLPPKPRVSPHDPAVQEALWLADLDGRAPRELLLIGVVPEHVRLSEPMSPRVHAAGAAAIAAVVAELARLGARIRPRPFAERPRLWWLADRGRPGSA